jgi:cathepsin L|eukprot:g4882.t1
MCKLYLLCFVGLAAARPFSHDEEYSFDLFKKEFSKSYASDAEHATRESAFNANLRKIREHNADATQTWKMGMNMVADLTGREFAARYLSAKSTGARGAFTAEHQRAFELAHAADVPVAALPASLDWRTKNVVTPVKNQGGCGSCWAFSTAETLESHIAIQTGKLLTFAPQEFVSCAPNPQHCGGTGGCQGSTQWLGFKYAETAGITLETSYPYTARTGTCDESKIKPVANITGYVRLPANNYSALMNAVATKGPVAISAAAEPWQLYDSGVYNGKCGTDVDHAIQLVGYGSGDAQNKKAGDYWLVRNSWGASWGEKGYIRIARFGETTAGEPCATDTTPGDGTACAGGPKTLEVCGLCGIMSDSSYPTGGKLA